MAADAPATVEKQLYAVRGPMLEIARCPSRCPATPARAASRECVEPGRLLAGAAAPPPSPLGVADGQRHGRAIRPCCEVRIR